MKCVKVGMVGIWGGVGEITSTSLSLPPVCTNLPKLLFMARAIALRALAHTEPAPPPALPDPVLSTRVSLALAHARLVSPLPGTHVIEIG